MSLEQSSQGEHAVGNRGTERAAYTVSEFCAAHRISRSTLYELWAAGAGPRFILVGSKRIITVEAAADWRRRGEVVS
jgi:predicted DNA-binding transcriptional regulator AlpA